MRARDLKRLKQLWHKHTRAARREGWRVNRNLRWPGQCPFHRQQHRDFPRFAFADQFHFTRDFGQGSDLWADACKEGAAFIWRHFHVRMPPTEKKEASR